MMQNLAAALVASLLALASCSAPSSPSPTPASASPAPPADGVLAFSIDAGDLDNHFVQSGAAAVHVVAASGRAPRLIFAFPAGDTGAGLWFERLSSPAHLWVEDPIVPVHRERGLEGASATIHVGARSLRVRGAALGSIRALRKYTHEGAVPDGFESRVARADRGVVLSRTMLDGAQISLAIEPVGGARVAVDASGAIVLSAAPSEPSFAVRALALTGAAPLSPMPRRSLFSATAALDPESRDAFAFLAYREKLLAGSWRFLTYFGRDTLLSLQMMMPALGVAPIEAGLGSVLDRLGPSGEVAHEEAIGEWAVYLNQKRGLRGEAARAPSYDYSMVDNDFLLAPALARYLLDTADGRARAEGFLARRGPSGEAYRVLAERNFDRVLALAAPFAASRAKEDLIALKPETRAGDWRDSDEGLGLGRVPYDVNVALVPAALEAIARLSESAWIDGGYAAHARTLADAWRSAASLFRVEIPEDVARARVAHDAAELGIDPAAALATLDGPVTLDALALDASGAPIPVLHSDVGFTWLYDAPPSDDVERAARRLFAPFPAGLVTPVGVLVANPAFAADPTIRGMFTPHAYHGTVVWSWQQALLAAGIVRQLGRVDLSPGARGALHAAERILWDRIDAAKARGLGTAELWSFRVKDGRMELVPFGQGRGDADESNAVQLWSTAYLAVRPSWEGPCVTGGPLATCNGE